MAKEQGCRDPDCPRVLKGKSSSSLCCPHCGLVTAEDKAAVPTFPPTGGGKVKFEAWSEQAKLPERKGELGFLGAEEGCLGLPKRSVGPLQQFGTCDIFSSKAYSPSIRVGWSVPTRDISRMEAPGR